MERKEGGIFFYITDASYLNSASDSLFNPFEGF